MKRHKVDPNNLPTEEVLAINSEGHMAVGQIYQYDTRDVNRIACDCRDYSMHGITHYILKSDLLNLNLIDMKHKNFEIEDDTLLIAMCIIGIILIILFA